MGKTGRKALAAGLSICLMLMMPGTSWAEQTAVGDTMRLAGVEGAVSVKKNGNALTVAQDMRLFSGSHVSTEKASYAYVSLDDDKAVKVDEMSEVEVRKKGRQQELLLISGNLFFNVKKPLASDETMNIRTSTMVTGVRGTSGIVRVPDGNHTEVYLLEGSLVLRAVDPVTGRLKENVLRPGQKAAITAQGQGTGEESVEIAVTDFSEEDVSGFAAVEIAKDPVLLDKIGAATEFDMPLIAGTADKKLMEDQGRTEEALKNTEDRAAGQKESAKVDDVFAGSSGSGSSSGSNSGSSSGSNSGSGSGSGEGSTARHMVTMTLPVTAAELDASLSVFDVVLNPGIGADTLVLDQTVTVPAQGTLTISPGVSTVVGSGASLLVDGTLDASGPVSNAGSIRNTSANTFRARGGLANTGSIDNTGRIVVVGDLTNHGDLANHDLLEVSGTIYHQSGTFTVEGDTAGKVESSGALYMASGSLEEVHQTAGSFSMSGGTVASGVTIEAGASFVMEAGEVRSNGGGAVMCEGTARLNGGTVMAESGVAVDVSDGELYLGEAVLKASDSGDILRKGDDADLYYRDALMSEGRLILVSTQTDGSYMMKELTRDLEGALEHAVGGDIVTLTSDTALLRDIILMEGTPKDPVVLDLNGYTLTAEGGLQIGEDDGTPSGSLTVQEGKLVNESPNGLLVVGEGSSLFMEDVTVESDNGQTMLKNMGSAVLSECQVNCQAEGVPSAKPVIYSRLGELTIEDSTVTNRGPSGNYAGTVIDLDGGSAVLSDTQVQAFGDKHALELGRGNQGTLDLTIEDGTEISNHSQVYQTVSMGQGSGTSGITIHFSGGAIWNSAGLPFDLDLLAGILPDSGEMGTEVKGTDSDFALAYLPGGYTVEGPDGEGYYVLTNADAAYLTASLELGIPNEIADDTVEEETEVEIATPSNATWNGLIQHQPEEGAEQDSAEQDSADGLVQTPEEVGAPDLDEDPILDEDPVLGEDGEEKKDGDGLDTPADVPPEVVGGSEEEGLPEEERTPEGELSEGLLSERVLSEEGGAA